MLPVLKVFMTNGLGLTLPNAQKSHEIYREALRELEEMFSDGRKYIMGTEEPTFVDFALSAEVGVLYCHPKYGGR